MSDERAIAAGTAQNALGLVVAGAATVGANLLVARVLGPRGLGIVTVVTQALFVLSFATRAGMDMAVLRHVAIEVGAGRPGAALAVVARAAAVAFGVSTLVGVVLWASAPSLPRLFSLDASPDVFRAAAVGLPALGVANVWLAATRGLKLMRHTLYIFWIGQPVAWIALTAAAWLWSTSAVTSVAAYSASWALAAAAAYLAWRRATRSWNRSDDTRPRLAAFAVPRAVAALLSQLLFWTDLFVLTHYASTTDVGTYSAALRAAQVAVLFLTAVNLMFSPYVADLHARGETERLDRLFKSLTRWTIAATAPVFLLFAIAPSEVLGLFGDGFVGGRTALLILVAGQLLNVATGSVGFVLIMAGRAATDLAVYVGTIALDIALAVWLCPRYGIEGAAVANAVTFGTTNLLRLYLVRRLVGIWPYDRLYLRLVAPAAASAAAMAIVHALTPGRIGDLVATGLAGALVYLLVYVRVAATEEERAALAAAGRRIQAR